MLAYESIMEFIATFARRETSEGEVEKTYSLDLASKMLIYKGATRNDDGESLPSHSHSGLTKYNIGSP